MPFSTLITVLLFSTSGWAGYVLQDDYFATGNMFDNFDFFTGGDPTHGFVEYQSQSAASSAGLISSSGSNAKMNVDSTNVSPDGRPSVRITSKKSYNSGLIVLDLDHMPGGICGTWPAFWTVGPNWPSSGEIDIIEGVNDQNQNDMTLHTGPGCSIGSGTFSGALKTTTCESSNGANAGCQIAATSTNTYGSGFNAGQGGVYAMEWTGQFISVYFFPRGSVPSDALGSSPNPNGWGTPVASFSGGCDMATSFTSQQIVFDTTFCGDWAGSSDVWSSSTCSQQASTCNDFVANNPSAFKDAYWSVNALKVYTQGSSAASSPPEPTYAPTSTVAPPVTSPVATSSPAETGYAPWVGPDGSVQWGPQQSAAPTGGNTGGWTTNPDGTANYNGKREEEDGFADQRLRERAAKHLRVHKRHGSGRL